MKERGKEMVEKGFAAMDKALAGKDYLVGVVLDRGLRAVLRRVLGRQADGHEAAAELRGASQPHAGASRGAACDAAGRPRLSDGWGNPGATLARVPFWYLRHGETDWNAQGIVARQHRYSAEPDRDRPGPVGCGECCAIAASPPSSPRRCRVRVSPPRWSARRLACRSRSTPTCARWLSAYRKARQ